MKIAIHHRENSYSDRWIEYCIVNNIQYKIVDCLSTNILEQLDDCNIVMWHWSFADYESKLFAYKIILALEIAGKYVYPSSDTCWHYDDKVAQKYLLEAIDAPLVPSYIFTTESDAMDWIHKTEFPKVFKLKSGAGSANVRLIKNRSDAVSVIRKAFHKGFPSFNKYFSDVQTKVSKAKKKKDLLEKIKRMPTIIKDLRTRNRLQGRQIGYAYFQDFLPDNKFDIRINIIGNRAFGSVRYIRENDFRASGSGNNNADPALVDMEAITISFDVARKINSQSLALDFIYDRDKKLKIIEISYGFPSYSVHQCPGYWDEDLKWHAGQKWPEDYILEDILSGGYN